MWIAGETLVKLFLPMPQKYVFHFRERGLSRVNNSGDAISEKHSCVTSVLKNQNPKVKARIFQFMYEYDSISVLAFSLASDMLVDKLNERF